MDRFSPEKRKNLHLRSRSRSRSKEHTKKNEEKIHNKSKKEEIVKKETKMLDSKELEKKFKDFEAEIHAIDPSNKSEKNETKQKKTFETTENLNLLYNNRVFVEGFPLEECEEKGSSTTIKEDYQELFKEAKEVSIMKPLLEGKPYLLIEFESRDSLDLTLKYYETHENSQLKFHEEIQGEEQYSRKKADFLQWNKEKKQDSQENLENSEKKSEKKEKTPSKTANENKEAAEETEKNPKNLEENHENSENSDNLQSLHHLQNLQNLQQSALYYMNQNNNKEDASEPQNFNSPALQNMYSQQQYSDPELINFQQQNGYAYLNYDNLAQQSQYLYSLKQEQQPAFQNSQDFSQYQYSYYPAGSANVLNEMSNLNAYGSNYKNNAYGGSPEYGFNLNSLNLQITENPNALQLMPKILPEANVFIKNLNPITTTKDLENAFRVYGNILSCKIATDYYGQSLSYGYIQFEHKESADACIQQANNAVFQDMIISVQPFNSKLNKIDGRNNLYIKNLPTYLNDDQLNQKITEIFSKFGPITSSCVKMDRSLNRPFAFVCYENHIYADMAFKALHDTDPFRSGNRLYISWAEKKIDRVKRLTELHASQHNLQQNSYGMISNNNSYYQNEYKSYQNRGDN